MKRCAILLHDGFELVEALATYDILSRSHCFAIDLLSDMDGLTVNSSCQVSVNATKAIKDVKAEDYDFLILPGGKAGVEGLYGSTNAISLVKRAIELGKHVHAICAAPSILGRIGFLKGKQATCFPGFEIGEAIWIKAPVVTSQNTVTARSMGYSIDFGHAIVKLESGEEASSLIYPGQLGLN